MKTFIILLFLMVVQNAMAVCTTPISRTNNSANTVLTSTKYNLDFNTIYSRVNELPGDCITDATISTAKIADGSITAAKLDSGLLGQFIPAGTILPFGGTVAPTGFLLCNGQTVSRTTYAALYTAIGTNFGPGNGTSTFHVPDLRGRFLRGVDGGAGRDPNTATRTAMQSGGNSGDNVGSIQEDSFQDHSHAFAMEYAYDKAGSATIISSSGPGNGSTTYDPNSGFSAMSTVAKTGFGTPRTSIETRPKNANVQFIIKY